MNQYLDFTKYSVVTFLIASAVTYISAQGALPPEKLIRVHKCPEIADNKRIIKAVGEIRVPKQIKTVFPKYPSDCQFELADTRAVIELLINEKGEVECVEILKNASSECLRKSIMEAVKQWRYEVSYDSNQQPVACYHIVTININPK